MDNTLGYALYCDFLLLASKKKGVTLPLFELSTSLESTILHVLILINFGSGFARAEYYSSSALFPVPALYCFVSMVEDDIRFSI